MLRTSRLPVLAALMALAGCSTSTSATPAGTPPASDGTVSALPSEEGGYYTSEQSERGRELFDDVCGECHYTSDFRGRDFEWNWRRQTARNLFTEMVETMPEDAPGSLTDREYIDVLAYILRLNDYPAGEVELRPTEEAMERVPLGPNARSGAGLR